MYWNKKISSDFKLPFAQFVCVFATVFFFCEAAIAFDQQVTSTLWAEGYSVPSARGGFISKRRIVEDLHLAAWNLLPNSNDPYYDGPRISVELALRLDSDFAITDKEINHGLENAYVPGLTPLKMNAMFAYVDARGFWNGVLDVKAGRQIRVNNLGFFAFDGIETNLFLPAGIGISSFIGWEVRGGDMLGYDQLELDGTNRGSRDHLEVDRYLDLTEPKPRMAFGTQLSWVPLRWLDAAVGMRTVGLSDQLADQRYAARLAVGNSPVKAFGRIVWAPMLDRHDDIGAALKQGTLLREGDIEVEFKILRDLWLTTEYHLYRPIFEADSIFNVFDLAPRRDLGGRFDLRPLQSLSLSGWTYARFADGSAGLSGDKNDATVSGIGGGLGGNYHTSTNNLTARLSGLREWGETRLGLEVGGGHGFFNDRLWLRLRGSLWKIDDELSKRLSGNIIGYVISARFKLAEGAHVAGEFENYFGGGRDTRFTALVLLQLDLWR